MWSNNLNLEKKLNDWAGTRGFELTKLSYMLASVAKPSKPENIPRLKVGTGGTEGRDEVRGRKASRKASSGTGPTK